MATAIYVPGPTQVLINSSVLGYSDNDNLPAIQFTDFQHEVKTVLSGQAPEEVVLQGTVARISIALVKWDPDVRAHYRRSPLESGRRQRVRPGHGCSGVAAQLSEDHGVECGFEVRIVGVCDGHGKPPRRSPGAARRPPPATGDGWGETYEAARTLPMAKPPTGATTAGTELSITRPSMRRLYGSFQFSTVMSS